MKKSNVTYGQLKKTLNILGFDVLSGKNSFGFPYIRFENKTCDAIIIVRAGADEERLDTVDLLSAERTIDGRGVTNRENFLNILQEAEQKEPQVAEKVA